MLCSLCETFLTDLVHHDVATWKRLSNEEQWYAFKHGNYYTVEASAAAGCELCRLFNHVRRQRIRDFDSLAEKWHRQSAMIDIEHARAPRIFRLLTEAPEKSWIPFELFAPGLPVEGRGEESVGVGAQLPFHVSPEPESGASIQIARRWIDECRSEHVNCARSEEVPLPTRIIDVGIAAETSSLRLCINSDLAHCGQYVTLSHCWGSTEQRLILTKRTLNDFQKRIPYDQLPKTFQDAVSLTQKLGMQYLWIDALCIVQDDQDDWRRESAAMCAVYENAALSVSATSATDSDSGLLIRYNDGSCLVTIDDVLTGVRPQLNSLDAALQRSKIESRAWCMQETILAPAILHTGSQQWFWECRAGVFSESYPAGLATPQDSYGGSITTKHRHILTDTSYTQLLDIWYDLVGQYSARELTKPSDRLPAIAGLAAKLRRGLGGASRYSYGLWVEDYLAGLLWQRPVYRFHKLIPSRDHYSSRVAYAQEPARFKHQIAPSWSWAAVRGAIDYSWRANYSLPQPSARLDLAVVSSEQEEAVMHVEGYLKRGTCRVRSAATHPRDGSSTEVAIGNALFKPSGSLLADDGVACILDYTDDVLPKSCYCLRVSSWYRALTRRVGPKTQVNVKVFYLILERLQTSTDDYSSPQSGEVAFLGKFKRIGMGYDSADKVNALFLNAERHMIKLA